MRIYCIQRARILDEYCSRCVFDNVYPPPPFPGRIRDERTNCASPPPRRRKSLRT